MNCPLASRGIRTCILRMQNLVIRFARNKNLLCGERRSLGVRKALALLS